MTAGVFGKAMRALLEDRGSKLWAVQGPRPRRASKLLSYARTLPSSTSTSVEKAASRWRAGSRWRHDAVPNVILISTYDETGSPI